MKNAIAGIVCLLAACAHLHAAADAVAISGAIGKPGDWTVARIKSDLASDITSVSYTAHDGSRHTSTVVPLLSVLRGSGLNAKLKSESSADPKVKHFELRLVVAVTGRDGYTCAFSLAELQPDLGNRHVWLALDSDGKALPDAEGPLKLIATDDEKPARWVHGVESIRVINIAVPATQASH